MMSRLHWKHMLTGCLHWKHTLTGSLPFVYIRRRQLSLLIFAQIMVQMAVEAAFSSNSTKLAIKAGHVLAG